MKSPVTDPEGLILVGFIMLFASVSYLIALSIGPLFPILFAGAYVLAGASNKQLTFKIAVAISTLELALVPLVGWQSFWAINLILGFVAAVLLLSCLLLIAV